MGKEKNFDAVRMGRVPGIYKQWHECEAQTRKFKNAVFRGFATLGEARCFMGDDTLEPMVHVPATPAAVPQTEEPEPTVCDDLFLESLDPRTLIW